MMNISYLFLFFMIFFNPDARAQKKKDLQVLKKATVLFSYTFIPSSLSCPDLEANFQAAKEKHALETTDVDSSRGLCNEWIAFCKKTTNKKNSNCLKKKINLSHVSNLQNTSKNSPQSPLPTSSDRVDKLNPGGKNMSQNGSSLSELCDKFIENGVGCDNKNSLATSIESISDSVRAVRKSELKKIIYEKSLMRLMNGVENFQNDIKMGGSKTERPQENIKNMACCDELDSCLEGTSYGNSKISSDTRLGTTQWKPSFCPQDVDTCKLIKSESPALKQTNVDEIKQKLSAFIQTLKANAQGITKGYAELKSLTYEEHGKDCGKTMTPSQIRTGRDCSGKTLSPAELAKKILNSGMQTPAAKEYIDNYNSFVAHHRMLAAQPYVVLLTADFEDTFSGKNLSSVYALGKAVEKMNPSLSDTQVKAGLENFIGKMSKESVCSMKRLYAGKGKNSDWNGLDDCNLKDRDLLAMVQHNPNLSMELIQGNELAGSNFSSNDAGKLICIPFVQAASCRKDKAGWESYTKWGIPLAALGASFIVPYATIPYFYAQAAIDVANSLDEVSDAQSQQNQLFARLINGESNANDFYVKFGDNQDRLNSAQVGVLISAVGGLTEVVSGQAFKNLGKRLLVKVKGPAEMERDLQRLIKAGDQTALEKFLKANPQLEVEVLEETAEGATKIVARTQPPTTIPAISKKPKPNLAEETSDLSSSSRGLNNTKVENIESVVNNTKTKLNWSDNDHKEVMKMIDRSPPPVRKKLVEKFKGQSEAETMKDLEDMKDLMNINSSCK